MSHSRYLPYIATRNRLRWLLRRRQYDFDAAQRFLKTNVGSDTGADLVDSGSSVRLDVVIGFRRTALDPLDFGGARPGRLQGPHRGVA